MTGIQVTTRNATLPDLVTLLKDHRARALDLIAPAATLRARGGQLVVHGAEPIITDDGVTTVDGLYLPTEVGDEGLAYKLGIPQAYLKDCRRKGRTDIWDANVDAWLQGNGSDDHPADPRKFMLRLLKGDEPGTGILRALVSDRYKRIDNLDVILAALDGIRQAGVNAVVDSADLTERRMRVRVIAPEVTALAPVLLAGYRNPFGPGGVTRTQSADALAHGFYEQGNEPIVFAGFEISNSETGGGSAAITPRITLLVCRNGATFTSQRVRAVHVGEQQEEGILEWSADTQQKVVALITAKTRDAAARFLSPGWLAEQVAELERDAGAPLTGAAPVVIHQVAQHTGIPQGMEDEILAAFVAGGTLTAGGIGHAITAAAQMTEDGELAALLESAAMPAMAHAAAMTTRR